jgi:hypothetical protein
LVVPLDKEVQVEPPLIVFMMVPLSALDINSVNSQSSDGGGNKKEDG